MPTYALTGAPTVVDGGTSATIAVENTGSQTILVQPGGVQVAPGASVTRPGWRDVRTTLQTAGQAGEASVTLTPGTPAAAPGPGPVRFDPGAAGSMSISITGGSWFTDEALTTAATFPRTISAATLLYPAAPATVTIAATVGTATQTRGMRLDDGGSETFRWEAGTVAEQIQEGLASASSRVLLPDTAASTASTGTLAAGQLARVDASGGAKTRTLPSAAAAGPGGVVAVRKTDSTANTITIARAGSDTIDGATSRVLTPPEVALTLVSDGVSNWSVASTDTPAGRLSGTYATRIVQVDGAPLAITKATGNPLIQAAGTSLPSLYWPWLIKAGRYVSTGARGAYYLYVSTNHAGASGQIGMLHSSSPSGPWTWHGVVYQDTHSGSETETPSVIWNEAENLFFMYYQQVGATGLPSGQAQGTLLATSPDGLTWTRVGPVFTIPTTVATNGHTGYARPFCIGRRWYAHSLLYGGDYGRFALWYSIDGRSWSLDTRPLGNGHEWVAGTHRVNWNSGTIIDWQGRPYWVGIVAAFASGGGSADGTVCMAPVASDLRSLTGPPVTIIDNDTAWESGDFGAGVGVYVEDSTLYIYYTSGATLAIGLATGRAA